MEESDRKLRLDTVFLQCLRCTKDGTPQNLDVIFVEQELLVIACGAHKPPIHVCSVKVDGKAFIFSNPFQKAPPVGTA